MSLGFVCSPNDLFDIPSLLDKMDKYENLGKVKRNKIQINCYQNNWCGNSNFWIAIHYQREKLLLEDGREKIMTGDGINCFFKNFITDENEFKDFMKKALNSEKNKCIKFNLENNMRRWKPIQNGKVKIVQINK